MEQIEARLLAGPFDGDEGYVMTPLPEKVWVFACGNKPYECPFRGIHWLRSEKAAQPDSVVYERGPVDNGVQVYVYRDLGLQSHDKSWLETPAPRELQPT